jgi:hypothetical protein
MIANDCHEIIENDDLTHAGHFFRGVVIHMLHLAAEHWALGKRRELHIRHHGVDAVDGLAVRFVRRVPAPSLLQRWLPAPACLSRHSSGSSVRVGRVWFRFKSWV